MKLLKVTGLVSMMILGVSACGDEVLTKQEVNSLPLQQFAITACTSVLAENFEQLEIMMEEKYFSELKNLHDEEQGSWSNLSNKVTCTIESQKPIKAFGFKSEMFKFNTSGNGVLNISIAEADGQKFVDGFYLDGFNS